MEHQCKPQIASARWSWLLICLRLSQPGILHSGLPQAGSREEDLSDIFSWKSEKDQPFPRTPSDCRVSDRRGWPTHLLWPGIWCGWGWDWCWSDTRTPRRRSSWRPWWPAATPRHWGPVELPAESPGDKRRGIREQWLQGLSWSGISRTDLVNLG